MRKVEIEWTHDDIDCETCGGSWAEGAKVKIDGVPFGDFTPYAHCYDSTSFTKEEVYAAVMQELGVELIESDQPYDPSDDPTYGDDGDGE